MILDLRKPKTMRLSILLFLLYPLQSAGASITDEAPSISGKVVDASTGQPLEYATVGVYRAVDDELITGGITDEKGEFKLAVDEGAYVIKVQFVTFQTTEVSVTVGKNNRNANLGTIEVSPSEKELDEVVVTGERTQMELSLDKKVYNVGKDLSSLGGSASDILGNLPSVTVDVEGNVELRGSSSVKVLIDGKPSGLVGLSSTDALRQLQGNMIERVEIITNPSARYDAEGMAGIINIVLKKDKGTGLNGSFQVNTGYPHNHGASANLNFRKKWINLFVNYGIDYRSAPGQGGGIQQFRFPDTTYTTELDRHHLRGGISNNVRFGSDFYLNDNNTITTAFLYRYSDELNESELQFRDYDMVGNLGSYTRREDDETEGDENLEYSLNYTRTFDREGHKLTADVQYQSNYEVEASDIVQYEGVTQETSAPGLFQKVRNEEGEDRLMFQSDYVQPFAQKGKVEAGFRSTIRNVKNVYSADERYDPADEYVPVEGFNTDFAYNEQVHAFYGIASNELDRISWQLGLRSETTTINTEFQETSEKREWNYTNFFPSAFLTYKLEGENQLQLSYSRRINRPRFRELNPFSSFTDNRNFRLGNPELQPEFTDSYEFGFLQNMNVSSIYYGVYYRHTTQLIQRVQFNTGPNETETLPYNIGQSNAIGLEANVSHEFTDWYRVSGNFNFYRNQTTGNVGDTLDLGATAVTFTTRLSNNFKIKKLFDAQLNVNYRAPENMPQGRRLSVTVIDMGLSRDIWNNKGTLSFSVRDLLNSRKWRSVTELPTLYSESEWQWRKGPTFALTLNYRLNQKKQRPEGSGGEEYNDDGF